MSGIIEPGGVLGVLGGGQLGRMFTLAARRMGYRVTVFAPQDDTPAGQIAYQEIRSPYEDLDAVEDFARSVDVVTFEFENVPATTAAAASKHAPVRPTGALLHQTQDRGREKAFLRSLGLPTAAHELVDSPLDLDSAASRVGFPAILKTAAWGYDGHGQRRVNDATELAAAFAAFGETPCVLEGVVPFEVELSVIGARGLNGDVVVYEPMLNKHANHILDVTLCPAPIPIEVREAAEEIARVVLESLDVVGVLCVELFLMADGSLRVNEVAPRPHNSGHVTLDAHITSQFEQQVRAVCGLPLGAPGRVVPAAAMANLLGEVWSAGPPRWADALADPGVRLHLYGKDRPRPGRKMGHLTVLDTRLESAERRARAARDTLGTPSAPALLEAGTT